MFIGGDLFTDGKEISFLHNPDSSITHFCRLSLYKARVWALYYRVTSGLAQFHYSFHCHENYFVFTVVCFIHQQFVLEQVMFEITKQHHS